MGTMAETALRQLRESLGVTREGLIRRTRSVSATTIRNAELGKRVTYDTAQDILQAINSLLAEQGKPPVNLDDLGLTLY